jgi:hypothetical protein
VVLSSGKQPLTAGHMCVPAPQTAPQTACAEQAEPVGHGVQSTPSIVPQVAVAVLLTQSPLHMWWLALQAGTHWPLALQVTLPFAGGIHTVQVFPHDAMLVLPFATHRLPLLPVQT